jgi:hypothetical protein
MNELNYLAPMFLMFISHDVEGRVSERRGSSSGHHSSIALLSTEAIPSVTQLILITKTSP